MTGLWSCTDTECRGDCTWCNRAPAENPALGLNPAELQRRCLELERLAVALSAEVRSLRTRMRQMESRQPIQPQVQG
ncbi:MAG: hypothetical protein HY901_02290 [Deltaproteobacteria bacterium]|nr:hypothetical protein [Deltaproteobacteria bacterium]